jgi:hypothetical protein
MIATILLFPFRILGKILSVYSGPVDATVSDSYYYSKFSKDIIYSPMGNWFELGYSKLDADKKSFKVIARDFGKDKNIVFYKDKKISGADVSSFVVENRVIKDSLHVYSEKDYEINIVEGADPKSYKYLDIDKSYRGKWAKDNAAYFLYDRKVEVDYDSLIFLKNGFVADKNSIYETSTIEQEESIPSEQWTGWGNYRLYAREAVEGEIQNVTSVYIIMNDCVYANHPNKKFQKIIFEKINSIRVIDEISIVVNDTLLVNGEKFPYENVDHTTFENLNSQDFFLLSKDKNHVYLDGKIIEGADAASLRILGHGYSRDKQHVYYYENKVEGVEADTFRYNQHKHEWMSGKKIYRMGKLFEATKKQ